MELAKLVLEGCPTLTAFFLSTANSHTLRIVLSRTVSAAQDMDHHFHVVVCIHSNVQSKSHYMYNHQILY